MRMRSTIVALVAALSLGGCAAVALTAGGIAAGAGVNHTLSGIAYKTFNDGLETLRIATLITLEQMAMEVTEDTATDEGWEIIAVAAEREINIELEMLTERATRMRVVANEGEIFFKDSATATEIILLTAENLEG
ncbi:MAG: DUF3568 family protein [Alphaproteobacteria bacterium]|nr:DUF3568 family protein [Alphaproteobacteria bacterium]